MKPFSLKEATEAVCGTLYHAHESRMVSSVTTDSRTVPGESLFVAIQGEFFDGHRFAQNALQSGALCVLSHEELPGMPHILVKDTKHALLALAKWYLEQFSIPVVAVTGSVGKTTTKDMIGAVLGKKFNILKNEGNFNNEVGLPLTVFNIDGSHEIAVLEMGMNSFGEIRNLSKVATPEVCVITNVGNAHIGNLGSREGVLKAKSEIFDFADKNAVAILNGDDDMLKTLSHKTGSTFFFGMDEWAYCRARKMDDKGLNGTIWRIYVDGENFMISIALPGDYLIYNAMAAVCVGKHFGMDNESIACGLKAFKPSKNRMDIFQINGVTIINDVYNASPVSMKAMLDSLSHVEGRKICILGDMLELGADSASYHQEAGRYAGQMDIDMLICAGEFAGDYKKGFETASNKPCVCYGDTKALIAHAAGYIENGDTVLVKASRGMKFERIIEELERCL